MEKKMNEKQLWDHFGAIQRDKTFAFGPHYSYEFRNTPRQMIFALSRYKFAVKMIGPGKDILELGCNEGLGAWYLAEFAASVHGVDFDEEAISWAKKNIDQKKITFACDDFLGKKYSKYDAVVSFDVIEHIYKENEGAYLETVTGNLKDDGIAVIGTPNIEGARFSNPKIAGAHVNMYSAGQFQSALGKYFKNVFLFSQNDEMIHTGFPQMAHYLICLCCYKK